MFSSINDCPLPENALLRRFAERGDYTDCFFTRIDASVAFADYVAAFYTTAAFKTERLILHWLFSLPSSDAEASQLARGEVDKFAAWNVLQRADAQVLLMDVRGRTCSWFMLAPDTTTGHRLYFGSAVINSEKPSSGRRMKWSYRRLLGFHRLYSRILLSAARARLLRHIDAH